MSNHRRPGTRHPSLTRPGHSAPPPRLSHQSPVAVALLSENTRHVAVSGGSKVKGVKFEIGSHIAGTLVPIVRDDTTIAFCDVKTGGLLIEHPWHEPGTRYVSNGKPRGPRRAPAAGSSPEV